VCVHVSVVVLCDIVIYMYARDVCQRLICVCVICVVSDIYAWERCVLTGCGVGVVCLYVSICQFGCCVNLCVGLCACACVFLYACGCVFLYTVLC